MFSTVQKVIIALGTILTLLAVWILSVNSSTQATPQTSLAPLESTLEFDTAKELQSYFKEQSYHWPPETMGDIPSATLVSLPSDLKEIEDVKSRKLLFIQIMLPIIYAEQQHIRTVRQTLIDKLNRTGNNAGKHEWFKQLLKEYKVKENTFIAQREELLNRIDELPIALIMAQAAIESGWGTSRFAREGNSLFGQWTFAKKGGLVPEDRQAGKSHQVKAFDSLRASVRSYLKNINRNTAYKELRQYRKEMRQNNEPYNPFKLAEGLHRYSQKGKKYVDILHSIMNSEEFKTIQGINT